MAGRRRERVVLAAVSTSVVVATAGCAASDDDGPAGAAPVEEDTSVYTESRKTTRDPLGVGPGAFQETVRLPDGRRVHLYLGPPDQLTGADVLFEQHYSPQADAWTRPQVIFRSSVRDPCQVVTLVERDGLVAAAADFAWFCFDGEPPEESVAAVSSGDLTGWEVHVTEGFDGWDRVEITDERVRWRRAGHTLTWSAQSGFARVSRRS